MKLRSYQIYIHINYMIWIKNQVIRCVIITTNLYTVTVTRPQFPSILQQISEPNAKEIRQSRKPNELIHTAVDD